MTDTNTETAPALATTLLEQLQADFDIPPGEVDMLVMDMPNVPPQAAPVLMQTAAVVQTVGGKPASESLYGAMGVCMVSPTLAKMGVKTGIASDPLLSDPSLLKGMSLYPQDTALRRLEEAADDVALQMAAQHAAVQILQQPKHGVIVAKDGDFNYVPNQGYVGNDKVVFLVNIDGRIVKTVYYLKVVDIAVNSGNFDDLYNKYCHTKTDWRISFNTLEANLLVATYAPSWMNFAQPNITVNITDLAGNAVGQTTGQGPNAQITLDSTAVNHGWFIDATPDANEEFLPTSDPAVWQARAGSAADGKMDMLSVLLHEYGHALGIEHSADSRDFMAANLQAGQRRLPGADELALMRQLAAALKPQQDSADNAGAPQPLPRPYDPSLPLGGGFAFTAAGLLRRKDYGWSLNLAGGQNILTPAPAQFEHAINSTLGHNANDWQSAGNVSNDQQGGVTLAENSTANAHLSQSFAVKQGDRYLSFTVAGNGLQDNGGAGPNDAFEVALLNADSGLSVAGSDGLSRSDAILNLQTDGTQHQAAGALPGFLPVHRWRGKARASR